MTERVAGSPRPAGLVLLVALSACAPGGAPASADREPVHVPHAPLESVPRVLVMTAMDSELAPLLELADVDGSVVVNGRTHHLGTLGGIPVVLTASGVSMVNATMSAQAAVDRLPVRAIVFTGIAGTPSPEVRIGDVTVASRWAEYQENVFTDPAREGWRRGWRNDEVPAFGFMHPQRVWTLTETGTPDHQELRMWFPVDEGLLAAGSALSAADVGLLRCHPDGPCLDQAPRILVGGSGVSGPTFVDDAAYRDYVWQTFGADALDMESAAVGHVAYTHGVPYVAVRGISDLAGGHRDGNRVASWLPVAAANAAAVTEALLQEWDPR